MALRCAILDDYQNVALKLADWSKLKDVETKVYTDAVRRTDADTIRDCKDLRDRRDDARAHALSPRRDRGAAQAQAPDHHRRLQRLDRHEGLPGARHHGLRHHQPRQSDHRHRLRPDAGADPPDRLGERPDEGRRALAAHARHGHRGQDAGPARPRQARRARGRRRQGVRHEGHRLEPEPHARALQGGRRRLRLEGRPVQELRLPVDSRAARRAQPRPRHRPRARPDEEDGLPDQHLARADRAWKAPSSKR